MLTLTYQRKKPQDGDDSAAWMEALADNIVLNDAHTHDGVDSPTLSAGAVNKEVESITVGDWTGTAGSYSLASPITVPAAYQSASTWSAQLCVPTFIIPETGERLYLDYSFGGAKGSQTLQIYNTENIAIEVVFS